METNGICRRHRRFAIAFSAVTMTAYGLSFLGIIAIRELLGFSGQSVSVPTIAIAIFLSGVFAAACYFSIKMRYYISCPKCSGKLKLGWWIRSSKLHCQNTACRHSVQCDVGF